MSECSLALLKKKKDFFFLFRTCKASLAAQMCTAWLRRNIMAYEAFGKTYECHEHESGFSNLPNYLTEEEHENPHYHFYKSYEVLQVLCKWNLIQNWLLKRNRDFFEQFKKVYLILILYIGTSLMALLCKIQFCRSFFHPIILTTYSQTSFNIKLNSTIYKSYKYFSVPF